MRPLVVAAAFAALVIPACASAQGARSAKAEACRAEAQSRLRVGKTAGSDRVAIINQRRAYWRQCMGRA
ncbi:MAG TPA: hypothetical protein VF601_13205 [Beijerinckiaceae bacterium]|jgi:hypothetical protein